MQQGRWQITLALSLMGVASVLSYLQISIFHAGRDTFSSLFLDLAFVPVQVLLATFLVDRFLRIRERAALLKKLNMVIGAFFSEVGTKLLKQFDADAASLAGKLVVSTSWTATELRAN